MELVANVWPVMDSQTGMVLRFMLRAYAMDAPDDVISATLRALAPTDFRMAQVFPIPKRFTVVSEHGSLEGCVRIDDFHAHQSALLTPAFQELESTFARLQGIKGSTEMEETLGVAYIPRFPDDPYLVVTTLVESPGGQLVPHVSA